MCTDNQRRAGLEAGRQQQVASPLNPVCSLGLTCPLPRTCPTRRADPETFAVPDLELFELGGGLGGGAALPDDLLPVPSGVPSRWGRGSSPARVGGGRQAVLLQSLLE